MSIESEIQSILQEVLDVKPEEIKADEPLEKCLGVDSTEMVEISVAVKKRLQIPLADNELKKSHSVNEIIQILQTKQT